MLYLVGDCGKIVIFAIFAKFANIFSFLPFLVVVGISGHISDGFEGSVTLQAHTTSRTFGEQVLAGVVIIFWVC